MTTTEINHHTTHLIAEIERCIEKKQYYNVIEYLTLLSHCNINLLNKYLLVLNEANDVPSEIQLEIALFQSEQKLNEQKIDEAAILINSIHEKSIVLQHKKVTILVLLQQAVLNLYLNKTNEAIDILNQCEAMATKSQDELLLCEVCIYAYHFYSETNTAKAAEYIYKALDIAKANNNTYKQAYSLMHIGTLNTLLNNNEVALNFYEESYSLFSKLKLNISMADNCMCRFNIYYRRKAFTQAADCLKEAIQLGENCGWDHKIAICYGNLSVTYTQLQDFNAAKLYAEKDIQLSEELNNYYNVGIAKLRLGKIETALGQPSKAIQLINESLEIRKEKITKTQLMHAYKELFPLYAQIEDYRNAFEVQAEYMQLMLAFTDAEKAKEHEALRAKYEAEKREAELKEALLQQTESELKALKAQMNPHFIFNALNSIQEIFFLGDKRLANKHLSRFSNLMRSILSASSKKQITLEEELNMLQEYVQLEQLRFSSNFQFEINVNNDLDIYSIEIPPMIIQPIIENAIKHGLMHKEGDKKLTIQVTPNTADSLNIIIEDNGIGRKASTAINAHRKNHESFATAATQKRIEMLNENNPDAFSLVYEDMEDANGNALGTKVIISISLQ